MFSEAKFTEIYCMTDDFCKKFVFFENLFLNGIQLATKVKNNVTNSLMSIIDKILLRKGTR